jgi:hypothetical protein
MIGFAAALALAAPPAARVEDLGWMSGPWVSETREGWTEELWMAPRRGLMLGTNRSGKGARATGFEYMRIEVDGAGRIAFWGSPGGKPAVAFTLVSSGPREAVFENPAHDFPTRIVYRRQGERLVASVSGPGGKGEMR